MASNLREETINGYRVAACENSRGKTFYLYTTQMIPNGDTQSKQIWAWHPTPFLGSHTYYGHQYTPTTMPSGFSLAEAENHQPVLKR